MLIAGLSGLTKELPKRSSTFLTASVVSHAMLTMEMFYIAVLPVLESIRNAGEVQLIK